jgi:hypothetical protein
MMWSPSFRPRPWIFAASGPKPLPSAAEGKAVHGGQLAAEPIQDQGGAVVVTARFRGGFVPLDVDDDGVPAVRGKVGAHEFGVGEDFVLRDSGAETVPAVPAHGRRLR